MAQVTDEKLQALAKGFTVDGVRYSHELVCYKLLVLVLFIA